MPSPTLSSVRGLRQSTASFDSAMPHHRSHARQRRRHNNHHRRRHYSPLRIRPGAYSDASYSVAYRSPPHSPPDSLSGGSPFSGIERVATPQWRAPDLDFDRRDVSPRVRSAPYFGRGQGRDGEFVFRETKTLVVKQRMATGSGLPADRDGRNRGLPWLSICEEGTGRVLLSAHGELGEDVEVKGADGEVFMIATRGYSGGEGRWDEIRVDDMDGGMVVDARLSETPRRALALSGRTGGGRSRSRRRSRSRSVGRNRSRSIGRSRSGSRGRSLSLGGFESFDGSEDWADIRSAGYGMFGTGLGRQRTMWGEELGGMGRYGYRGHGMDGYGMGRRGMARHGMGWQGMGGYVPRAYGMERHMARGYDGEGYEIGGLGMDMYDMGEYEMGSQWRGRSRSRSRSLGRLRERSLSRDQSLGRDRSMSRGRRSATPRFLNRARSLSRSRMENGVENEGPNEIGRRGWEERRSQSNVGMGMQGGYGEEQLESSREMRMGSRGVDERLWQQGQRVSAFNFGNYTNGRRQFTSDGRIDPDYFQRLRFHNSRFLNNPYSDMLTASVLGRGGNGVGAELRGRGIGLEEDLGEDGERIMEYFGGKGGEFWLVRSSDFMRENFESEDGVLASVSYYSIGGGDAGEACYQMFLQGGVDLVMIVGAMVARLWIAKVTDGVRGMSGSEV
eukprot:GFKZ01002521.1.p1 GENE.GFKZ01002521.1~~GFKZ01002521.1.p1  ORF type:complete len:673 (+),score=62.71 GFKZ01002521.1:281-2299(+)